MQLDKEAIKEFKSLYLKEYGVKLDDRLAVEYGIRLISLVKAVYGDNLPILALDTAERRNIK